MCRRGSPRVAKPSQFGLSAVSRFVAIASSFEAVFFDQYGVLHDGRNPYPGARDALAALKSRGVKIVVLSNSGRTGAANAERMTALGFEPELYDFLVTSGDVARTLLKRGRFPALLAPGARCFVISTGGDDEFASALGVVPAAHSERGRSRHHRRQPSGQGVARRLSHDARASGSARHALHVRQPRQAYADGVRQRARRWTHCRDL